MSAYRALDVMGFAGGFTLGVVQAGFHLVGKRELKGGFGVPNCEANRHLLGNGWQTQIGPKETWDVIRDVELVFGNPPCSGFSNMSDQKFRGVNSPINSCMVDFVSYAARCAPPIIIFESVQSAFKLGRPLMTNLFNNLRKVTGKSYTLYHIYHNAIDLGGAAIRPRYFWVASSIPFGVDWPTVRRPVLNDILSDLHDLPLQWELQPHVNPPTWWSEQLRTNIDHVDGHFGRISTQPLQSRISALFDVADDHGGWLPGETLYNVAERVYLNTGTLPQPAWDEQLKHVIDRDFDMGFTVPRRWHGDRPARVISGAGIDNTVHPFHNRTITHREAARIMGFPDNWLIEPIRDVVGLHATWGKGITVQCGQWIAHWVRAALDGNPGPVVGTQIDDYQYFVEQRPSTVVELVRRKPSNHDRRSTMTEIELAPADETGESTESANAETPDVLKTDGSRRGRPRPQHTLERDRTVATVMRTGVDMTVDEICRATGLDRNVVYACLHRLSWGDGNVSYPANPRVIKTGRSSWRASHFALQHDVDFGGDGTAADYAPASVPPARPSKPRAKKDKNADTDSPDDATVDANVTNEPVEVEVEVEPVAATPNDVPSESDPTPEVSAPPQTFWQ